MVLFNVFNSTFIEIENKFNDENFSICIVEKWLCYKEFSICNLFDKVANSFALILNNLGKRDFIKIISDEESVFIQSAVSKNIVNADEIAVNLIANSKKITPYIKAQIDQKIQDSPRKKSNYKADLKNDDFEQANYICQTDIMYIYKEMITIKCFYNADAKEICYVTNEFVFAFYIYLNDINYDRNTIICTPKFVLNQGVKFFTPYNPKTNIDDISKFLISKLADNRADSVNNGDFFSKNEFNHSILYLNYLEIFKMKKFLLKKLNYQMMN